MALINTSIRSFDKKDKAQMPRAAIYSDNDWNDEVKGFDLFSVKIHYGSDVIEAPVETGTESFDNKVIKPTKVHVVGKITIGKDGWQDAVRAIETMMANRNYEFYSVCDGCDYAKNLILKNCPIERNPEKFDFINVELEFVEALLIQKDNGERIPRNSENTNSRDNGYVNGV